MTDHAEKSEPVNSVPKKKRRWLERWILSFIRNIFYPLPLLPAHWLGVCIGIIAYAIGISRNITHRNLQLAFGNTHSALQRFWIAIRAYAHYGGVMGEILVMPRLHFAHNVKRVAITNIEVLETAAQAGKGVILVSGHHGNWMWIPTAIKQAGFMSGMYSGTASNPLADRLFKAALTAMGAKVLEKHGNRASMLQMLRTLKAEYVLGMAVDQHFSRKEHFIHLFGQPCSASPGTALLTMSSGAPVVFVECIHTKYCHYQIRLTPITLPAPVENRQLRILQITQCVYWQLQQSISAHPEQYFWMHNLWRERDRSLPLTETNRRFLAESALH